MKQILLANPGAQYEAYKQDIKEAVNRVLESGWYVLGKKSKRLNRSSPIFMELNIV